MGSITPARRSVIVTGGASGIGLAMTKYFAGLGDHIAVLDVNATTGPDVVSKVAAEFPQAKLGFKKCDVSSWQSQAAVFKEVFTEHGGHIDVVMANAGISERGQSDLVKIDDDEPSEPSLNVVNVNFIGVVYSIKLASHYMNKKQTSTTGSKGTIICTASNAGLYPFAVAPMYAATKSAVVNLVRSLAKPFAISGIQIHALAPAVLETNISPNKDLFKKMIITPFSTLTKGVAQLLDDPTQTGYVAEIHGSSVTIRPPPEIVDEDTAKNIEVFWNLGYA